jgi:hypothetical protein
MTSSAEPDYHCLYQNNDFRFEKLCKFCDVAKTIVEEISQYDFETLIPLIQQAIANKKTEG